jgi:hypothetical protein
MQHEFMFDSAFNEDSRFTHSIAHHTSPITHHPSPVTRHTSRSNNDVFQRTAKPLVEFVVSGGKASCFAFGQTGVTCDV